MREKNAPPREVLEIFARTQRIAEKFGAKIFLNGRADCARAAHADGLHLPETEISVADARLTVGFHTPCGVSVHDLENARRAEREGANYLLFRADFFPTLSHPDALPVGLDALAEVVSGVSIPVFAVGGINASNAAGCLEAGAAGVAAISAVWSAPDIAVAVRALRAAVGERDEPRHGAPASEENNSGIPKKPEIGFGGVIGATPRRVGYNFGERKRFALKISDFEKKTPRSFRFQRVGERVSCRITNINALKTVRASNCGKRLAPSLQSALFAERPLRKFFHRRASSSKAAAFT